MSLGKPNALEAGMDAENQNEITSSHLERSALDESQEFLTTPKSKSQHGEKSAHNDQAEDSQTHPYGNFFSQYVTLN